MLPKLVDYITSRTRRRRILVRPQRLQLRGSLPSRRSMRPSLLSHPKMPGPRSAVFQSSERRAVSVLHRSQMIRLASPKVKGWNRKRSPANQVYGDACFAAEFDIKHPFDGIILYLFSYLLFFLYPGHPPIDWRCLSILDHVFGMESLDISPPLLCFVHY